MSSSGQTPHSNDPRDNQGEYVLGKDGRPLVDRYGRPVRRRAERSAERPAETRYEPRRTPHQQRQYLQQRQQQQQQTRVVPAPARQQMPAREPVRQERPVPMHVHGGDEVRRPREARGPRRRRKAKAPGCLALVLVLALIGVLFTDARLTRLPAMPEAQIADTAGTNWLLVGSDSREGLSQEEVDRLGTGGDLGSTRTDTIMLLHIPRSGGATLLSIPRDSYVEVPGWGWDKINVAFSVGGAPLLVETVERATGLRVNHYAEVGMGGLANVVDAVGGVEICVAEAIDDPLANLNVQPGCQQMNGAVALGYVRTRATAQGDLDRVARQREFLGALVDRVVSPAVLLNPFRLVPLAWTAPTMFAVGEGDHVWNLARIALAMRGGLATETVPLGGFMDTEVGSVVLWDEAAAEELFAGMR